MRGDVYSKGRRTDPARGATGFAARQFSYSATERRSISDEAPPYSKARRDILRYNLFTLLWLTHVYGLFFFGTSAYFSFNDLATLSFKNIHILGAAVRLLLPVVVGFGLARLSNGLPLTEATVSAFLGALLLCWPTIYFPDLRSELVNEDLAGRPAKLLMIDGLCILSYSALGRLGAIGGLYYENLNAHASIQSFWKKVRPADLVWTLATGLLTNAIWELTTRNSK